MGLVSPGGVHSHQDHAAALAQILHDAGVHDRRARLHRRPRHAAAIRRATTSTGCAPHCRTACRSPPSSAATSRWTATSAGTASRKAYAALAEADGAALRRPGAGDQGRLRRSDEIRRVRPARGRSATTRACRTATASCASTSAPTGCAKSSPRCWIRSSTASRASASIKFAAAAGMTRYSDELAPFLGVLFPPEKLEHILGAGGRRGRHAPSFAWRRPRNTRTSPTS